MLIEPRRAVAIDPRLAEIARTQRYPLLFATVSGAHLYGFPSPDSDWDLRGDHILPPSEVVGLEEGPETLTIEEKSDGFELDLVTHDVKKFFSLLLRRNGYVLEAFHQAEVARLRGALEAAGAASSLAEEPTARKALHDLLLRVRLGQA